MTTNAKTSVTSINVLSVDPERQNDLVELLRKNTETVVTTLNGWICTDLIASRDGKHVVIQSQWETLGDVEAMRSDPQMLAYFPKIKELASFDSIVGDVVVTKQR